MAQSGNKQVTLDGLKAVYDNVDERLKNLKSAISEDQLRNDFYSYFRLRGWTDEGFKNYNARLSTVVPIYCPFDVYIDANDVTDTVSALWLLVFNASYAGTSSYVSQTLYNIGVNGRNIVKIPANTYACISLAQVGNANFPSVDVANNIKISFSNIIDDSLSITDAAADAKAVGDAVALINNNLDAQDKRIEDNKWVLDAAFSTAYQYIDTNEFMAGKYWYNSAGTVAMYDGDPEYYAYPEITLSAGTYYINYVPGNFAYLVDATLGTVTVLTSVVSNGKFTISSESKFYYTVRTTSTQSINTVMVANWPLPGNYVYGTYKVFTKFASLNSFGMINSSTNVLTVGEGGKYTTIQSACDAASVDDVIFVLPGVYTEQVSIFGKKLHIIGFDKKLCTIIDHTGKYETPPVEMNIGTLANFTIIEDSSNPAPDETDFFAYCIHNDSPDNTNGETLEILNCDLYNARHSCIGFGMYPNYTVKIRDCTMRKGSTDTGEYKYGALYFHGSVRENATGQTFIVENCTISSAGDYAARVGVPGSGSGTITARFINNKMWSDINGTSDAAGIISSRSNYTFILDPASTGNSIAKFNNTTPTQGSTNTLTINASSSAVVNGLNNKIVQGNTYQYIVISEDHTSYNIGVLLYDTQGAFVLEQSLSLCNVSFSADNGDLRVWNRDGNTQHVYTVRISPL